MDVHPKLSNKETLRVTTEHPRQLMNSRFEDHLRCVSSMTPDSDLPKSRIAVTAEALESLERT